MIVSIFLFSIRTLLSNEILLCLKELSMNLILDANPVSHASA